MPPRRAITTLHLTAGALLLATAAIVTLALTLPLNLGPELTAQTAFRATPRAPSASTLPSLADLETVAATPLRRALRDAPPAITELTPPSLPPLLRLTGTILEPGPPPRSLAVFASGLTDVRLVPIGGTIAGAELLAISPAGDAVTLRYEGRTVELTLHKPAPPDDSGLDPAPVPTPAAGTSTP